MKFLRFVGDKGCESDEYRQNVADDSVSVIDSAPATGNVTVHFYRNGRPLFVRFHSKARDLLDVAISVYIADEMQRREDGYDGWTRDFQFFLPVRDADSWRANESLLARVVSHLSGDRYSFDWAPRKDLPQYGRHRLKLSAGCDVACLYSGGVDSLLGALHYLDAGKKVLLCAHYADGITANAQAEIFGILRQKYGAAVSLIQCRVARTQRPKFQHELAEKVEDSHRPRSFLFLGIAAAIASSARVPAIAIPENGLIALNSPLGVSRSGTLSTRTAHPRFLADFLALVNALGAFTGTLHNPFLFQSKTDMVRAAPASTHDLLLRSVSCSHAGRVRWTGKKGIRHCGYCVPCLYRRVAFMGIGIDRASDYYCDVFNDLPKLSETEQGDLRFLTRFARQAAVMTPAKRQMIVLAQGNFSPEACSAIGPHAVTDYAELGDMVKRWADDFLAKLGQATSARTKRFLGIP